ncbi:Multidrug transporter EmrE [Duganella sp. CF458]|uniref:hypothetical protein n=1 Tax=Duganella sp. CF458 TaxID=1884368 RepID=UPI0008E26537|nr:hypothetical protein [Duganella sp. CF458]SFF56043.1 Multidrug transporter EmrE [Duganella sp. CF458]
MEQRSSIVFLAGMIACTTASQVLLKYAGLYAAAHAGMVAGVLRNPWLAAAIAAAGGGICCWLLTLRRLPLALAYPWTALVYVLTPLAGAWLFSEVLDGRYALGIGCILAGVLLTSRGVSSR